MTLVHAGGPWRSPRPVLLAERSRTARAESRCCLCSRLVVPGQRVADVVGGGLAHVSCTGQLTAGEPR